MNYSIASLSEHNIGDLSYLYKNVFGNHYSAQFIRNKYNAAHVLQGFFGNIAYQDGVPVAFHGAIPVLMQFKDNFEIAAQYGDAMTMPNHIGKGLFTKLGKLTDSQLQQAGVTFVWGFPNQNSEYGYLNKLDWSFKERMQGFRITTSLLPIEKLARKIPLSRTLFEKHLQQVFSAYPKKQLLKSSILNDEEAVSVCRNHAHYQYKSFFDNFIVDIDNVLFWIKVKNGLFVGDVQVIADGDFHRSLNKLKKIASQSGIAEIVFQASPGTFIGQLLQEETHLGFESWVIGYKNFNSGFPLEKLKFTFGDLDTF